MIKEWCENCWGEGSINSGGKDCPNCQGKGYTELEPKIEPAKSMKFDSIDDLKMPVIRHKKIEPLKDGLKLDWMPDEFIEMTHGDLIDIAIKFQINLRYFKEKFEEQVIKEIKQ